MTDTDKKRIDEAVDAAVEEYGETLEMLGQREQ